MPLQRDLTVQFFLFLNENICCDPSLEPSHREGSNDGHNICFEVVTLNQLLQLCTARTVFLILVTVRLYTVMPEVCHWLTNEKQRKTDILLTN